MLVEITEDKVGSWFVKPKNKKDRGKLEKLLSFGVHKDTKLFLQSEQLDLISLISSRFTKEDYNQLSSGWTITKRISDENWLHIVGNEFLKQYQYSSNFFEAIEHFKKIYGYDPTRG